MKIKLAIVACALTISAGCSTVNAAQKSGEELSNVVACDTSACLKTLRTAEVVERTELENGDTKYLMRIQKRQGSIVRSLGYGTAAIFTLGLSEVVATPLEGAIQNDKQMAIEAVCDANDYCHRLVIAQLNQPTIYVRGQTEEEQAAIDEAAEAEE
ncbi:MAG: hypothetical protein AAF292_09095 [Pseudomonadota bacterium]